MSHPEDTHLESVARGLKWLAEAEEFFCAGNDCKDVIRALGPLPIGDVAEAIRDQGELRELHALLLLDIITATEAERDAYKRAKQENDERFMRERDEARQATADAIADAAVVVAELRADLAAAKNELEVQYSLYLGIKKRLGLFPEDGRLPHDSIDALQAELAKLRQERDQVIDQLLESNRENLMLKAVLDQQAEQLRGTPEQRRERLTQLCVQVRLRLLEKGRLHGVSELGIDAAIACHAERLAAQAERDELRTELARLRSESRLSPPT